MPQYHKWVINGKIVDPNDRAKWTQRQAGTIESACQQLSPIVGELVKVYEEPIDASVKYTFASPSGSAELRYGCGHTYHSAPNVELVPKCGKCKEDMDKSCNTNPNYWSKTTKDTTPIIETVKKTIGIKKRGE